MSVKNKGACQPLGYEAELTTVKGYPELEKILTLARMVVPLFDLPLPLVTVEKLIERRKDSPMEVFFRSTPGANFWWLSIHLIKKDDTLDVRYCLNSGGTEWRSEDLSPQQVVGLLLKLMGVCP